MQPPPTFETAQILAFFSGATVPGAVALHAAGPAVAFTNAFAVTPNPLPERRWHDDATPKLWIVALQLGSLPNAPEPPKQERVRQRQRAGWVL